jgi:hypothetical protein
MLYYDSENGEKKEETELNERKRNQISKKKSPKKGGNEWLFCIVYSEKENQVKT